MPAPPRPARWTPLVVLTDQGGSASAMAGDAIKAERADGITEATLSEHA
ncbi:MAG: hypothetical protein WBA97_39735 [Actinophytocola sp.]